MSASAAVFILKHFENKANNNDVMFSYPSEQYTVFGGIVHHIERLNTRWLVSSTPPQ